MKERERNRLNKRPKNQNVSSTHHQNAHFLLRKEALEQFRERDAHGVLNIYGVRERVCFVMIDEAKRRSLLLFSRVGFFVLFCFSFSVDVLVHFCSPKKNKISCWINRH